MSESIVIDFENYKDTSSGRVEPGTYAVTVEDAEVTESKSGNPMIVLYLGITGGEFDGVRIIDRLTQTPKALFRTFNFMQAIGLPTPKKRIKVNLDKFIGKRVQVDLDDGEPYNGRVKSEVRGYTRLARKVESAAETSDLDDLDDEDVSDEPTDYDEDQEPKTVKKSKAKKSKKEDKASEPAPEDDGDGDDEDEKDDEIDLDSIEL